MASRRASMIYGSGTTSPTTGMESRKGSHTRRRLAELAAEKEDEEKYEEGRGNVEGQVEEAVQVEDVPAVEMKE